MHGHTAWRQWAVQHLRCTASLPRGRGQWTFGNALLHCLEAMGSATPPMHCLTARWQWAVEFLQRTASPPTGSGRCNS